jgi:hypothetical protein
MILLAFTLLALSFVMGEKEAFLYSRTGSDGVQKLLGKRFDHILWITERVLVGLALCFTFRFVGDMVQLWAILVYWLFSFFLLHTIGYNVIMKYLKVHGYYKVFQDSKTSTAWTEFPLWVDITLFCLAQAGLTTFIQL